MKRDKRITIKDFFYFYPYKKNIPFNGKTVPQPYVKKSDVVEDNVSSIDYNQWYKVVMDYINLISETLLTGKEYVFPNYIGKLQLRKYKVKREIDWKETKLQGKKVYYKSGYNVILKWYRNYEFTRLRYRYHWKLNMAKIFSQSLYEKIVKNNNFVYNILDT